MASARGAHKGVCGHRCACARTHTHTCSPLRPGPRRAQAGPWLTMMIMSACGHSKQLRPCFLSGWQREEGPLRTPKCPCQEQRVQTLPQAQPTHTPQILSPQVGSSLGASPLVQDPSQTAKYLSCLYTLLPKASGAGIPRPLASGVGSFWKVGHQHLSSSTCSPIRGIELSTTGRKEALKGLHARELAAEQCIPGRWAPDLRDRSELDVMFSTKSPAQRCEMTPVETANYPQFSLNQLPGLSSIQSAFAGSQSLHDQG